MKIYLVSAFMLILLIGASQSIAAGVVWGNPVEGIKIGVSLHPRPYPRNGIIVIDIVKAAAITNTLVYPEMNQRFECNLSGTNSSAVEKTEAGRKYGEKLNSSARNLHDQIQEGSLGKDPEQMAFFDIDKTFLIKETGTYILEIQPRLLKKTANGLIPITINPIKIKLNLVVNQ